MQPQPPPMMPEPRYPQDAEHIRLLAIFHYVLAGLHVVGACFMAVYMFFMVAMMRAMPGMVTATPAPTGGTGPAPPVATTAPPTELFEMMSLMYGVIGGIFVLLGVGIAWVQFLAGRNLSARRHRTFIFVVACLECLSFPFGTALGVFTLIVLVRPSVVRLFEPTAEPPASAV